jgi:ADP-ribose pyrophosphatase YjhB (NUDIX family)
MNHLDPVHFHFAVLATDVALFSIRDNKIVVRMMRVSRPPHFPDNWGLPGGLIQPTETSLEAAKRLLKERAHIAPKKIYLEQLYTFDAIERDPRGRVVAVAHLGLYRGTNFLKKRKRTRKIPHGYRSLKRKISHMTIPKSSHLQRRDSHLASNTPLSLHN